MAKSADAFRTISEVADWLGVQTHVLRFWESKFTQVKPVKRAGGRRYYRPADMLLLGGIQKLLHEDGLTIKGVQKILREKGMTHVSALSPAVDGVEIEKPSFPTTSKSAPPIFAPEEDVEPVSADVVPFVQEPRTGEDVTPIERPSFTQDAVVLPNDEELDEKTEPTPTEFVTAGSEDKQVEEIVTEPSVPEPQFPEIAEQDTTETSDSMSEPETPVESMTMDEAEVGSQSDVEPDVEALENIVPEAPVQEEEPISQETVQTSEPQEPDAPEVDETAIEDEPIAVLPSFLSRSPHVAPVTDNLPVDSADADEDVAATEISAPEPAVEAPQPKPEIIDVPDTLSEAEITAAPSALTALSKVRALTPAQAASIAPLLAHLRDVRDRMTQARKE